MPEIKAINLNSLLGNCSMSEEIDGNPPFLWGPLDKVNLIVGSNNSGKSRLLRAIARSNKLNLVPNRACGADATFSQVAEKIRELGRSVIKILQLHNAEINNLAGLASQLMECRDIAEATNSDMTVWAAIQDIAHGSLRSFSQRGNPHAALRECNTEAQNLLRSLGDPETVKELLFRATPHYRRLYIPTLRTLRDLGHSKNIFRDLTVSSYFSGDFKNLEVFTGMELYQEVTNLLLGDHVSREKIRRFEEFIGRKFFNDQPITLVPKQDVPKELTIKVGNEREYLVKDLGEGIQSVLTIAFPLFRSVNEASLILVEEPEMFLHPSLQRVILELFRDEFPLHQFFLTTHSNHFLDMAMDYGGMSIFTLEKELSGDDPVQKDATFKISYASGRSRRPLELLGVRNSSVLLTNCTVWIEGITDRKFIAHWLHLHQLDLQRGSGSENASRNFLEDVHYSFVEYCGSNLTHWSILDENGPDVDRLCGKMFLVADNDNAAPGSKKKENHAKLSARLGNDFFLLPGKEIENLLSTACLHSVLENYNEKASNLKAIRHEDYLNKPLGLFIEESMFQDKAQKIRIGSYAKDNTISDKPGFCERAIVAMKSWNDLSIYQQELTKRVYEFIVRHNSHN